MSLRDFLFPQEAENPSIFASMAYYSTKPYQATRFPTLTLWVDVQINMALVFMISLSSETEVTL